MAQALQTLNDKIVRYLREMEMNVHFRKECYEIKFNQVMLTITPIECGEEATILRFIYYILCKVPGKGNDALFRELSRLNDRYSFGRFYWMPADESEATGTLVADVCFLGEYIDFPVFQTHLNMIATTCEEILPALQEKFGGLTLEQFFAKRDAERARAEAEGGGPAAG